MRKRIYLDHNASSPVHPRALEAYLACLKECPGNPSSSHADGREARKRLGAYRESIATYFNVSADEVVFTSGGTESINLLLRGLVGAPSILSSDLEHSAVLETLHQNGAQAKLLSPGRWGAVTPALLQNELTPEITHLVLMGANNETGVKSDLEGIADLASDRSLPLIVDAVALLGKDDWKLPEGVSGVAFSGQKIGAPKGTGFAIVKKDLPLQPLQTGGMQEKGVRGGTENLPGIAALAEVIKLFEEGEIDPERIRGLRDRFEQALLREVPHLTVNGEGPRVSNVSNLCFHGSDGEGLFMALDRAGIAASLGSACSSGSLEPSRVLLNMGLTHREARSSIRFSLGWSTTEEEVDEAVAITIGIAGR